VVGERAKEARKVERSRERGDDGCENQKIKEVSPSALEEGSRVVDVRLDVVYGIILSHGTDI
jgi:hypothetical protein